MENATSQVMHANWMEWLEEPDELEQTGLEMQTARTALAETERNKIIGFLDFDFDSNRIRKV